MIGVLGDIVFSVSSTQVKTLSNMQKTKTSRIAKHDIIGNKPKLEFQGMDLDKFSFDIRLDASLGVNPDIELRRLERMQQQGEVAQLVIGSNYHGDYLINSIGEDYKHTDRNGNTITVEVSVDLEEYIYD